MGKQNRIIHEDVLQRLNFLYQAALQSLKSNPNDFSLCRFYVSQMGSIAKKQCLHLHHDLKRSICLRCCIIMIPGHTCLVRPKGRRQRHTLVSCLECGTRRRYIYKAGSLPWIDQQGSFEDRVVNGVTVNRPDKNNKQTTKQEIQQKEKQKENNKNISKKSN